MNPASVSTSTGGWWRSTGSPEHGISIAQSCCTSLNDFFAEYHECWDWISSGKAAATSSRKEYTVGQEDPIVIGRNYGEKVVIIMTDSSIVVIRWVVGSASRFASTTDIIAA